MMAESETGKSAVKLNTETLSRDDPLLSIVSTILGMEIAADHFLDTLRTHRLHHIARLLHYRIATIYNVKEAAGCVAVLEHLSEDATERLLRAPALCELLRLGVAGDRLKKLLEVELLADLGDYSDAWSAQGDVWLGRHLPADTSLLTYEHGRFRTPRLDCNIPLDFSLPPLVEHPSSGLGHPKILDRAETLAALESLNGALDVLRAVYPLGYSAFASLTTNLVLRREDTRAEECWGATSGMAIGRIVIVNPAASRDEAFLAEALLHEATHCALDCAELEKPMLRLSADATSVTVNSPWTGNPLSSHALLHACVVWSVLLKYWTSYCTTLGDDESVAARRRFIQRGFQLIDPSTILAPFEECLTEAATLVPVLTCEFARALSNGPYTYPR